METMFDKMSSIKVQEVFEYWQVRMGTPRARLDQKRRQKIRQRLLDGYTVQDLTDAIEGCASSPFNMGQNDRSTVYNDIELICRDAAHVDRFIAVHTKATVEKKRAAIRERERLEYEQRKQRELTEAGRRFQVVPK